MLIVLLSNIHKTYTEAIYCMLKKLQGNLIKIAVIRVIWSIDPDGPLSHGWLYSCVFSEAELRNQQAKLQSLNTCGLVSTSMRLGWLTVSMSHQGTIGDLIRSTVEWVSKRNHSDPDQIDKCMSHSEHIIQNLKISESGSKPKMWF